jgi:hypothetical protein
MAEKELSQISVRRGPGHSPRGLETLSHWRGWRGVCVCVSVCLADPVSARDLRGFLAHEVAGWRGGEELAAGMQNAIISAQELWEKSKTGPKPHLPSRLPSPRASNGADRTQPGSRLRYVLRASYIQKQSCILGAALGMQHILQSWVREGGGAV